MCARRAARRPRGRRRGRRRGRHQSRHHRGRRRGRHQSRHRRGRHRGRHRTTTRHHRHHRRWGASCSSRLPATSSQHARRPRSRTNADHGRSGRHHGPAVRRSRRGHRNWRGESKMRRRHRWGYPTSNGTVGRAHLHGKNVLTGVGLRGGQLSAELCMPAIASILPRCSRQFIGLHSGRVADELV